MHINMYIHTNVYANEALAHSGNVIKEILKYSAV